MGCDGLCTVSALDAVAQLAQDNTFSVVFSFFGFLFEKTWFHAPFGVWRVFRPPK